MKNIISFIVLIYFVLTSANLVVLTNKKSSKPKFKLGILTSDINDQYSEHEKLTIENKVKTLNINNTSKFQIEVKYVTLPAGNTLKSFKYGKRQWSMIIFIDNC